MTLVLHRGQQILPLAAFVLLTACFGLLAGINPSFAAAAAVGLAFTGLVFASVTAGLCFLTLLAFMDIGDLGVSKAIGALLVASWLALIITRRDLPALLFDDRPALSYLLALLVAWMVLSLVWATDPGEGTTALTRYAPNLLLVPIVYTAVRTRRQAVWVLGALVAGGAIAATTGVISPPADPGLAVAGTGRSTGTIGDANQLAAALVVALALAGAFVLNARMSAGVRLVCAGVALVSLLGIFMSLSRGGLIALGVAVVVAVLASGRWRGRAAAAGLAVVSCGVTYFALFASLPARERVTNFGGDGTGRLDLWTIGGRMVADEPLRGVGVGNFPVSSVQYLLRPGAIERPDFIITTPKVAHNTYLQFFAELGAIGGLLFVAIVIYCGVCAMRAVRSFERHGDVGMEILARGLVVALAGYLTAIVFLSENYSNLMWILLALGPALLAVSRRPDPEAVTDARRAPGAARSGAGPP